MGEFKCFQACIVVVIHLDRMLEVGEIYDMENTLLLSYY